jgi:hypothetical protein
MRDMSRIYGDDFTSAKSMKQELYEKIHEAKISISKMGLKLLEANHAYDRVINPEVLQE